MKLIYSASLSLAVLIANSFTCFSQVPSTPMLNELNVPTSPGFVLLDKSPASIEKPTNPKALGITVLNLLSQNEGAIDVTPYWLRPRPRLTFMKSVQNKTPFAETLNLSVAGSKSDKGSYLSAGARAHLFRMYCPSTIATIDSLRLKIIEEITPDTNGVDEDNLKSLTKRLAELRSGSAWDIELAAAAAGFSPENSFSSLSTKRFGIWLNAKWQPLCKFPCDVVGVFRYTHATDDRKNANRDTSYLDWGLALSYQQDNFDIQLEYVKRHDLSNTAAFDRTALVANYMVSDNVVVVASLGKNFDQVQNILAVFGVKFGLSRQKVIPE